LLVVAGVSSFVSGSGPARDAAGAYAVRSVGADERARLVSWLEAGLRDGRRGRLAQEYGPILHEPATRSVVATAEGRFVSHALARAVDARAGGITARIGMIGLVYTDDRFRRRGLAARCIRECERWLAARGAALVALWSDRHDWYARLGYHLAGIERTYVVDTEVCAAARRLLPFEGSIGAPGAEDWPVLEALHAAKPSRASRAAGYLRALGAGGGCRTQVARRGGRPVAYAILGRGDDFPGVVHEWAGEPAGVVACLGRLLEEQRPLGWLAGPCDEAPAPVLRAAGAGFREGGFALVKVLEPGDLWRQLSAGKPDLGRTELFRHGDGHRLLGDGGARDLCAADAARLLLGPGTPEAAGAALSDAQRRGLSSRLPWPLFVWGLDSV
jgi:predicted N-acetyltransferase YhbS